jgi:hypothetical protein
VCRSAPRVLSVAPEMPGDGPRLPGSVAATARDARRALDVVFEMFGLTPDVFAVTPRAFGIAARALSGAAGVADIGRPVFAVTRQAPAVVP